MFRAFIAAATWLLSVIAFQAAYSQEAPLSKPTLDDFLADATFWSPELSPSGSHIAGIRQIEDETYLIVADLDAGEVNPATTKMSPFFLNWIEWATDDRMLISVTGYLDLNSGDFLTREDFKKKNIFPVPITRLIAMNRDRSDKVILFGDSRKMNKNFYLGGVVDFLIDDPSHILMAARRGGDLDLFKVNIDNGSFERIAIGTKRTFRWYVDRDGEPAFRYDSNSRGTVIRVFAREDKANGKIKWRKIKTIREKRNKDNATSEFDPLFVGPTETTYYVAARPEGENTTGIYLYDFEKDEFLETLKSHPEIDIENAIFNRSTREVQGYYYFDDKLEIEFLNPKIQAHLVGLNTYFGGEANVVPIQSSRDGNRWLLYVSGPQDPGSYHTYDVDESFARQIGNRKLSLAGKSLADMKTIHFTARDGLKLRGYLTRPANVPDDAKPPLIMLPHGGPEARDVFGYDETVQILAAQGYQVFQPNFRGSSGFGKTFANRGRRQWGKAMQTDLDDGLAHLIEQGYAEAGSACIMGSSYGGYAALAAATMTPDLYQCAISIAGISDLEKQLKFDRKETGVKSEEYKYLVNHIGDPKRDKEGLRAASPAKLVDQVTIPILLIHGENDRIVPARQSEIMKEALEKAGKQVRYVPLPESSHSYRGDGEDKKEYEEILAFLKEHLPPDPRY